MPISLPTVTSGWHLEGNSPGSGSQALVWNDQLQLRSLGPTDVLVRFYAWSLNYPDLAIANGTFPWKPSNDEVFIPGSDGAGEVLAVGSHVRRFHAGDPVIIVYYPNFPHGIAPTLEQMKGSPGSVAPGTFREFGVFDQDGLIAKPSNLTYTESATLPCSALTAWNALYGLNPLKPGDYVLAQGTGGVSLFAILFALAAGAVVIATTSSDEKADRLRKMGVQHVLNYKLDPNWGETARKLSPAGLGCQRVIEVGGPQTIAQSFRCVARGGEIGIIGFLTGLGAADEGPTFLEPLLQACIVRGVEVGNRIQFEEMVRAIEAYDIRPVVDDQGFSLEKLKDAYEFVWNQQHFGKTVVSHESSLNSANKDL